MEWVSLAIGLFGGGLIVYFLDWLRNRGDITLDSYDLSLYYYIEQTMNYLLRFQVDLQFINSSGRQEVINNFSARFFDGENFMEIYFGDYTVPPADVIEPRHVKCIHFTLYTAGQKNEVPMLAIYENSSFLEISYRVKNKKRVIVIKGNDMRLLQTYLPQRYIG